MTRPSELPDGTYTAVVDSIEDGLATVFFEADGSDVADAVIDVSVLPEAAQHADAILTVSITDGDREWTYDPDMTQTRQQTSQDRFDCLSSRPPSDDDG